VNKFLIAILLVLGTLRQCVAQQYQAFTHADTLRGMLTPLRSCYNVTFYDLHLKIDPAHHTIGGYNVIAYKVVNDFSKMQIDLFFNMKIDSIIHAGTILKYKRDGNAVFVDFTAKEIAGKRDSVKVYYHGQPLIAVKPPWQGGFVWLKDANGKPWIDVACEQTGASLWWPCKDHLSDKPDSARMTFEVPTGLMCVSNGRLRSQNDLKNGFTRFTWFVSVPINNYDITVNIADYAHISDYYLSGKDTLTLDYYVLSYNETKARQYFQQVKLMLACYEKYFGKYPFYKDGYKLVETTYWGMEHQSCIAYGNNYDDKQWGFDFIIVHESAHEWWGNSVSCSDPAEMWLHESFATYAEALYVECTQDYKAALKYLKYQEFNIQDKYPIIGPYNVNFQGTENDDDMYYKGSWILHTFRHVLNDDSLFFSILKGIQQHFKYQTVTSNEVIDYINKLAGKNYTPFFNQYLNYPTPPVFDYKVKKKGSATLLTYRWVTDVQDFTMPVKVTSSYSVKKHLTPFPADSDIVKTYITITPTQEWQTIKLDNLNPGNFSVDTDEFYVKPKDEQKR
jgi:aminopeptidase N